MTVQEYAHQHNISERTVYRMIERGEIGGHKVNGKWTLANNTNEIDKLFDANEQIVRQLEAKQDDIEYLRAELSQANQTISEMQQRHDTIIMQLTKQLEQQTLMLEDMRHRSLWRRLKEVFAPANAGV